MRASEATEIDDAGLRSHAMQSMIEGQRFKERTHGSMKEPKSKFATAVNAILPAVYAETPLEKAVKRYFIRSLIVCLAIGLAYFLATVVHASAPVRFLCASMLVWFPLSYFMKRAFIGLEGVVERWTHMRKSLPVFVGVAGAVAALSVLSTLDSGADVSHGRLALAIAAISYFFSLWNVGMLSFLLEWRFFDKGGFMAAVLAILGGAIWAWLEHN